MKKKTCNSCQYENEEMAEYCANCGQRIEDSQKTEQKTNVLAIISLVLGICSLLLITFWLPLTAISLSVTAKQKIRAFDEKGNGMATAGLVTGIIGLSIWAIYMVVRLMLKY